MTRAYCSSACRAARRMSAVRGNPHTIGHKRRTDSNPGWREPNFLNLLAGIRSSRARAASRGACVGCGAAPAGVALCGSVRA